MGLAQEGDALPLVVDDWLGLLAAWVPAGVCLLAAWGVGSRRWETVFAAAAVTSFAAGDTYYVWDRATMASVPLPSPSDLGLLLFYR